MSTLRLTAGSRHGRVVRRRAPVRAPAPPPTHSRAGGRDPPQYTPPLIRIYHEKFPGSQLDPHPLIFETDRGLVLFGFGYIIFEDAPEAQFGVALVAGVLPVPPQTLA